MSQNGEPDDTAITSVSPEIPSEAASFALTLPRHCFSPREVPRPGDIWRLAQAAAIRDSGRRGWPPKRYLAEGTGFVVYGAVVHYHRPFAYGDPLEARTWLRDFRRGILSRREVRLFADGQLAAAVTQRWAHISADMTPTRASADLLEAFKPTPTTTRELRLPDWEDHTGPRFEQRFRCWHTRVDPLNHANHPAYVDWCEEALAAAVADAGGDPHGLVPVADRVSWKLGINGGESVTVRGEVVGVTAAGDVAIEFWIGVGDERRASAWTVRRLAEGDLLGLLSGGKR